MGERLPQPPTGLPEQVGSLRPQTEQGLPPLFSIVIVNWNGRHLLEECLASLFDQTRRDFEVIVVDNGSTDGSAEWIETAWGDAVGLLRLPANQGFAGGTNAGLRRAKGRLLVLLNNDTAADPRWLEALARAADRYPAAGMFAPKILNYYRRDEIDNTGHVVYRDGLARGHHRLERDDGRFDGEAEALYPSGCAGMYRAELLGDVGLFDESFFAYCEDEDLGLRARWAGWGCRYVPDAIVYHKYSATAGAYSPRKAYLVERNRLWTVAKNFPVRDALLSPFWTAWRYLLHAVGVFSGRGAAGQAVSDKGWAALISALLRAAVDGMAELPRVLAERRRLRPTRRISAAEFRSLLACFRLTAAEAALKD
jgi:GT2 family glycosyltransferase